MWRRVARWKCTDGTDQSAASVFRIESSLVYRVITEQVALAPPPPPLASLHHHSHCCKNLKFHKCTLCVTSRTPCIISTKIYSKFMCDISVKLSNLRILITRDGILILAIPRYIGYKNCWSDAPMQQEGWVLPLPTYVMGAVHHEMGIRSSQLIFSRCRDSV